MTDKFYMNAKSKIADRELRNFGLLVGVGFAVLFGTAVPLLHRARLPLWPWSIAVLLSGLAFFYPRGLNSAYKMWMRLGYILGWINTRLILGILFFVMMTPLGFLMRFFGRDPLMLKKDDNVESYRIIATSDMKSDMENPF